MWERLNWEERETAKLVSMAVAACVLVALQNPSQAHSLAAGLGWFAFGACIAAIKWRDSEWIGGVACALAGAAIAAECMASI